MKLDLTSYRYHSDRSDNPFLEYERLVARLAYPAVLPSATKRILAHSLSELHDKHYRTTYKLNNESVPDQYAIEPKDLTGPDLAAYKAYTKAKDALKKAEEHLRKTRQELEGLSLITSGYDLMLYRKLTPDERTAKKADLERRRKDAAQAAMTDATEFERLVREYADLELAKVRGKFNQKWREMLDRLTRTKALPAQGETSEPRTFVPAMMHNLPTTHDGENKPPTDAEIIDLETAKQTERKITTSRKIARTQSNRRKVR